MSNIIFANNLEIDVTIQQEWLDIVNVARNDAYYYLSSFRNNAGYIEKLQIAFGNDFDSEVANQLFDGFAEGNFSGIPTIEIVNRNDLNGANGAFAIATGKIYLAADFISQNAQNLDAIVAVLLEETGHSIDAKINVADAAGDEGDIFARLVQGKSISQQELAVLRAEDDTATVTLDGQVVEIEQATINGTPGNDSLYGTEGDDIIEGRAGNDLIVGFAGNDTIYTTYKGIAQFTVNYLTDTVYGGAGNDIIEGDNGTDKLFGEDGNDILSGWGGSDILHGGGGDDILYATSGINGSTKNLWGGAGSDTFILDAKGETKSTLNFNVEQLIEFNNSLSTTNTKWGRILKDTVFLGLGAALPSAGGFLYLANIGVDEGFDQLDALKQEENARLLLQQYPSDSWGQVLTSGTRDIILIEDFEIGVDTIVLPNLENLPGYNYGVSNLENRSGSNGVYVRIEGNNSQGTYQQQNIAFIKAPTNYSTNNNNNMSFGELILDMIDSKAGIISVFKKSPIQGDISSQPDINGTSAYDIINGLGGNDDIEGKAGNDIINGGDGTDTLRGGEGSDVFLYDSFSYLGTDTIEDFNTQQGDKIFISKSSFTGVIDKTKFSYNTTTNTLSFNGKNLAVLNANSGFNLQRDLIIEAAEIFEYGTYQGKSLTLEPGKYDVNDLINNGFGDNILSSLKVPNGWSMRLYHNPGFTGANIVYTSDSVYTGAPLNFNDTVSSLVVSDGYAQLFKDGNYQGNSFKLAPGEYDFNEIINSYFDPQSISSLIIPDGWKLTLYSSPYENSSRTIYQKVFNSSASWVGNDWNDRAYSLKVEAPQPVPALALTNNTFTGTSGNDNLVGSSGNDLLNGGDGNDILDPGFFSSGSTDTVDGGAGNDVIRVNYTSKNDGAGIHVRYLGSNNIFSRANNNNQPFVTISNVENYDITGTQYNDAFEVNSGNDTYSGGAGSDILSGGDGNDILDPGFSSGSTDTVDGGAGNNVIRVNYTSKNDGAGIHVRYLGSNNIFSRANGNQPIVTISNVENYDITGTQYNDAFEANSGNDIYSGGNGDDILNGGTGNDTLAGGGGKDTLTGGTGFDSFDYRNLADSLLNSFDVITDFNATTDNDLFLVSTARSGFSNAGSVATLDATGIAAKLTTTNFASNSAAQFTFGSRTFVSINDATAGFNANSDAIIEVTGFTGTLGLSNFIGDGGGIGIASVFGGGGNIVIGGGGVIAIPINPTPGILNNGTNKNDTLTGDAGNDTLRGGNGQDKLYGLAGDDFLEGQNGDDKLFGGEGKDILIGGNGNNTLEGGGGFDTFVLSKQGNNVILDFENGVDVLKLDGITFGSISITQKNSDTLIKYNCGNELATLQNVQAGLITVDDFITV